MKTIAEIHRANLQRLAAEFGGVAAVAARIGCSSSQYSQWMNGSENSGTGKPRGMRPSSGRRIEKACEKPEGWIDRDHENDAPPIGEELDGIPEPDFGDDADDHPLFSRRVRAGEDRNTVPVKRVKLRVSAGVTGFETEPDHEDGGVLQVPVPIIQQLNLVPHCLLALQVKGPSMEPMLFEDDWIVVNIADTRPVSREVYAINFDGEACIKQLVKRGMDWYMHSLNPDFGPVNIRSGQFDIVGKFVWQPGRVVTGRL